VATAEPGTRRTVNRELLGIYLNDHLAGSTGALELARRSMQANRGNEFGVFLERLRTEILEDRRVVEDLMDRLGIPRRAYKRAGAWLGEKVGRLKPNGSVRGYSPLSRVVELESLTLGVTGKLSLWQILSELPSEGPLAELDLGRYEERAREQLAGLEHHRRMAARIAFA
jgi:hypothetical protein